MKLAYILNEDFIKSKEYKTGYVYLSEKGTITLYLGRNSGDKFVFYDICKVLMKTCRLDGKIASVAVYAGMQGEMIDYACKKVLSMPREVECISEHSVNTGGIKICLGQYYTEGQIKQWLIQGKLVGFDMGSIYTTGETEEYKKSRPAYVNARKLVQGHTYLYKEFKDAKAKRLIYLGRTMAGQFLWVDKAELDNKGISLSETQMIWCVMLTDRNLKVLNDENGIIYKVPDWAYSYYDLRCEKDGDC